MSYCRGIYNGSREFIEHISGEESDVGTDISNVGSDLPSDEDLLEFSSGSEDYFVPEIKEESDDSKVLFRHSSMSSTTSESEDDPLPNEDTQPSTSHVPLNPAYYVSPNRRSPHLPTNNTPRHVSDIESEQLLSQPWVRVYPPEPQINIEGNFRVKNQGARNCSISHDPIEYFKLFVSDDFIALLTRQTNACAAKQMKQKRVSGVLKLHSRIKSWKNVTVPEMKKFLAIVLNMGLTPRKNYADYWSQHPLECIPWFSTIMPLRRFQAINANLNLMSFRTRRQDDSEHDNYLKVQPFLNAVNDAFKRHWVPSQHLRVDESIVAMKDRLYGYVIQYWPNKKHAYNVIKKFDLVDSKSDYILHTALYSKKDYLQQGSDTFNHKVVENLVQEAGCLGKNYHVFIDQSYTILPLAKKLLEQNTYLTGITNKKTKDLSKTVINVNLGAQESIYFRKSKILLSGYRQELTSKPVYLISTASQAEDVLKTRRTGKHVVKPAAIIMYNNLMGGVESKDKSFYHLACARPSRHCWKQIFCNLLDICILNSYIVYSFKCTDTPKPRKKFVLDIITSLASGQSEKQSDIGGSKLDPEHRLESLPANKQRLCAVCPESVKKRSRYWCPGCNAGIHIKCYYKLEHRWRPRGLRRH